MRTVMPDPVKGALHMTASPMQQSHAMQFLVTQHLLTLLCNVNGWIDHSNGLDPGDCRPT